MINKLCCKDNDYLRQMQIKVLDKEKKNRAINITINCPITYMLEKKNKDVNISYAHSGS